MCYDRHVTDRKASSADSPPSAPRGLRDLLFGSTDADAVRRQIERRKVPAKKAFNVLRRSLELSIDELSRAIDASPRTIERRVKNGAMLDVSEGDRAYRLARVADLAAEMLGDTSVARRWLRTPSRYMGGETPLAMLATEVGTQIVEQSLYAIGYGGIG